MDSNKETAPTSAVPQEPLLVWNESAARPYMEATLGDFAGGDGVRFTLTHHPSCYRRGPWRLLVEVTEGRGHILWGCFDDADQPMRHYHSLSTATLEAQAIAHVLWNDRYRRSSGKQ